eukprot:TRINITY_DN32934_c0_g1_i1.p1 TRINITY_DN32934_c0_g1~~TRINITY_DN32934_c0_g1_i1.p1  ORF type:complete len:184 (+),score=83.10 TRINITY_DN32934_c0_g1_i1:56-607(+)
MIPITGNRDEDLAGRCFKDHIVRYLSAGDYDKGFLDLLAQLTVVGSVTREMFLQQMQVRNQQANVTVVVENTVTGRLVATGSLVVEYKFIHECGRIGHIEDVVVDAQARGLKLGARVLDVLKEEAVRKGCYKVILDASEDNTPFYEKQGFKRKELQMRYDCKSSLDEYMKASPYRNELDAEEC